MTIGIQRIGKHLVQNGLSTLDDAKRDQLLRAHITGDLTKDFPSGCGVGEVAVKNMKARAGIESTWQVCRLSVSM